MKGSKQDLVKVKLNLIVNLRHWNLIEVRGFELNSYQINFPQEFNIFAHIFLKGIKYTL